jgi:hypothetical protein
MICLDLFQVEQISCKKSDRVGLTGRSFIHQVVLEIIIAYKGPFKNLLGRPASERNAPTIYGSYVFVKIAQQASQPVDVSGFASGCRILCKWVVSGLQVAYTAATCKQFALKNLYFFSWKIRASVLEHIIISGFLTVS